MKVTLLPSGSAILAVRTRCWPSNIIEYVAPHRELSALVLQIVNREVEECGSRSVRVKKDCLVNSPVQMVDSGFGRPGIGVGVNIRSTRPRVW
jgi:hypothetical protein